MEVDGGQSVQSHVVDKLEVSMSDKIALLNKNQLGHTSVC